MTDERDTVPGDDAATGYEEIVVSDDGVDTDLELRTTVESEPPSIRDHGDYGWGDDLKVPAWDAVRDVIDVEAHDAGAHVATIHYDLDAWDYTIEFLVETDRDRGRRPDQ